MSIATYAYDASRHCAYKFTGKERDTESGLDMFGARYYGSSLGRFMTPDWAAKPVNVPYAHFGNPQSLNLYSYVQNNPTTVGRVAHVLSGEGYPETPISNSEGAPFLAFFARSGAFPCPFVGEVGRQSVELREAGRQQVIQQFRATAFWQRRFYDFNVWSAHKHGEKLRYIHRNPVKRGLVETPDQWRWSSFRAYAFGETAPVVVNDWSIVKMKVRAA